MVRRVTKGIACAGGIAALSALGAGAARAEVQAATPAPVPGPVLTLRSCAVDKLALEGATLALRYEVANPTPVDLELSRFGYAVEVDGKRVADGAVPGGVKVPASGVAPVLVPVAVRFSSIPGFAAKVATKDPVPYRLTGAVAVRAPTGEEAELPIDYAGALAVPKLPAFGLKGFKVRSWNPFDAAVEVRIGIENENAFDLPPGALRVAVSIGGQQVASADGTLAAVPAGAKVVVPIPVKVSLKNAGRGTIQALKGEDAVVALHGEAAFGELSWPVDLEARVPKDSR